MSERIFAWLLKLYPLRFRQEYGASAMQLFRDRLQAERGLRTRFRLWLDIVTDLAVSVPRERRRPIHAESNTVGYHLSERAVNGICKRKKAELLGPFYIFGVLGLAAGWLGHSEHIPLLTLYAGLAIVGLKEFRSMGAFREQWRSYELILGTDHIRQRQHGYDLTLLRSEVHRIIERPQVLQVVSGSGNRPRTILIPVDMSGYQEVRDSLSEWMPITQAPEFWLQAPGPVIMGILCVLPAMLLTRSASWFLIVAVAYYGLILLEVVMNLARPLNSNWRPGPSRPSLQFAPPAHMWRRFKGQCRHAPGARMWLIRLGMIALPIVKLLVVRPQ